MEISDTSQLPQLATLTLSKPAVKTWRAGQLLSAIVVKVSLPNHALLRIDNKTIQANSNQLDLMPGQKLTLEVIRTEPQAILKVVNNTATPAPQPLIDALKMLLPRQVPLPPLLANLVFLASDGSRSLPVLPHNMNQIIKKLIAALPTDKKLSNADGLKRALLLSGMFVENKLASSSKTTDSSLIDQDFKANLLRLLDNLQQSTQAIKTRNESGQPSVSQGLKQNLVSYVLSEPLSNAKNSQGKSPSVNINTSVNPDIESVADKNIAVQTQSKHASQPLLPHTPLRPQARAPVSVNSYQSSIQIIDELQQQVNGAIARLQINQIASLSTEDNNYPVLSFELPLRHEDRIDVIQIRISQDRAANTAERPDRWSASLAMELESLGSIYATVTISQQQVWTSLWAERNSTVEVINRHLQDLYRGYSKAGLSIGATHCRHGTPPFAVKNAHKILVDINA